MLKNNQWWIDWSNNYVPSSLFSISNDYIDRPPNYVSWHLFLPGKNCFLTSCGVWGLFQIPELNPLNDFTEDGMFKFCLLLIRLHWLQIQVAQESLGFCFKWRQFSFLKRCKASIRLGVMPMKISKARNIINTNENFLLFLDPGETLRIKNNIYSACKVLSFWNQIVITSA